MTIAFLFPGQGAQSEGLLHHLPQHAEVARTIEEASDVLGLDIRALDNAEALHSTPTVQQALLIAGVATARALMVEQVFAHRCNDLDVDARFFQVRDLFRQVEGGA